MAFSQRYTFIPGNLFSQASSLERENLNEKKIINEIQLSSLQNMCTYFSESCSKVDFDSSADHLACKIKSQICNYHRHIDYE